MQHDKILTVFDFHSTNLPTKNGSTNTNNTGVKVAYEGNGKGKYVSFNLVPLEIMIMDGAQDGDIKVAFHQKAIKEAFSVETLVY